MPLYRAMLAEYAADPARAHYPLVNDQTPDEMEAQILQGLWSGGKRWYGAIAQNGAPVGFALAEVMRRPVGFPKEVAHVYALYVAPDHRARGGRGSVAMRLMRHLWESAKPAHPTVALEASAVVGSRTERGWQRLGFRPYQTLMAWVDPAGEPRSPDAFFARGQHHGR